MSSGWIDGEIDDEKDTSYGFTSKYMDDYYRDDDYERR